jgi:hypothetical protein
MDPKKPTWEPDIVEKRRRQGDWRMIKYALYANVCCHTPSTHETYLVTLAHGIH